MIGFSFIKTEGRKEVFQHPELLKWTEEKHGRTETTQSVTTLAISVCFSSAPRATGGFPSKGANSNSSEFHGVRKRNKSLFIDTWLQGLVLFTVPNI